MRLAGAKNEEVEIARVQHEHALLESTQAWQRFWPTLSAGGQYRGHDGRLQDIVGSVFDARKQQYSLGGAVLLDWAPGDIYYGALAAKQRALAAGQALEKARLDILREATDRYYEMLGAEAAVAVVADDLTVLQRYAEQLDNAVKVGTAFRADLLRVHTQISRLKIQMRQGEEQRGVAAARLCETLRLAPDTELHPAKADLVPIKTVPNESLSALVARGQINRPEIKAVNALGSSLAREEERVRLGPLVPSLQAGYSAGGFGGGPGRATGNFGDTQDYFVGFGWKIGPGGLFDTTRERIAVARKESAALQTSRTKAAVGRDVVEAALRSQSSEAQIRLSDEAVAAAEEMSKLAAERQASQVGVVLEFVLAREDLTRARLSRVRAVVDYNRAQQALRCAVGDPVGKTAPAAKSGSKQGR
jgi:outer membrane protein TolC